MRVQRVGISLKLLMKGVCSSDVELPWFLGVLLGAYSHWMASIEGSKDSTRWRGGWYCLEAPVPKHHPDPTHDD